MTHYSQNDKRWKNQRLGKSEWTMGEAGCFVTSMAVVATDLGHKTTPLQMLEALEKHNLINAAGDLTRADALTVIYPDIHLIASKTWPKKSADLSFISANTIVEIDDSPAKGLQSHFMPVEKVTGKDVKVMDVWDGKDRNVSAYGTRWKPAVSAAALICAAYKFGKVAPAKKPGTTVAKKSTPSAPAKTIVGRTVWLHAVSEWHVYRVGAQPILKNAIGFLIPKNYKLGPNGKPGLTYKILGASKYANTVTIKTASFGKVDIYLGKDAQII